MPASPEPEPWHALPDHVSNGPESAVGPAQKSADPVSPAGHPRPRDPSSRTGEGERHLSWGKSDARGRQLLRGPPRHRNIISDKGQLRRRDLHREIGVAVRRLDELRLVNPLNGPDIHWAACVVELDEPVDLPLAAAQEDALHLRPATASDTRRKRHARPIESMLQDRLAIQHGRDMEQHVYILTQVVSDSNRHMQVSTCRG